MKNAEILKQIADLTGARESGDGNYVGKCPAHDDKKESFSTKLSEGGKLLLHCFAGCGFEKIKTALEDRGVDFKSAANAEKKQRAPKILKKRYIYKDENGEPIYCVERYEPKDFRQASYQNGKWAPGGVKQCKKVLYNLPAVTEAVGQGRAVFFVEGEKDADALTKLGLVATSIVAGAGAKWDKNYTDALTGAEIVVIPDNDEPGLAHARRIARELDGHAKRVRWIDPAALGLAEKQDISDWLILGNGKAELVEHAKAARVLDYTEPEQAQTKSEETPSTEEKSNGKARRATKEDYYDLINGVLGSPKRCIFSGQLMHWDSVEGLYQPSINSLPLLRTIAAEQIDAGVRYNRAAVEDYFHRIESETPREFLLESSLPQWDKRDRVGELAAHVKLDETLADDLTNEIFIDFVKDWCSKMWGRIYNPKIQNRVLILKGAQGVGKDFWVDTLLGGLGQFASNLNVISADKDMYLALHHGAVLKIAEFDKTAKRETSTLKDLITTADTRIRAPYERSAQLRFARTSFIATCNVDDIFRDPTGHRRYLAFPVDRIEWGYSAQDLDPLQILAQCKELAASGYKASAESERAMREYLEERTPESTTDYIVDIWLEEMQRFFSVLTPEKEEYLRRGVATATDLREVFSEISSRAKMPERYIQNQLKGAGYGLKKTVKIEGKAMRGYYIPDICRQEYAENENEDLPF